MPGTVVRLTGLKVYRSKGIEYVYHRASGIRLSPPHKPGSPEFMRAYADACSIKKPKVNQGRTLDAAIDRYLDSLVPFRHRGERPKAIEILFSDECRAVAKEIFQANRKATSAQIVENPCDE